MRLARTLCAAAVGLGVVTGTVDGQAWNRGQGERQPAASAEQGRKLPPGQAKKLYRTDEGARVLRDVLARRGYAVVRSTRSGDVHYVHYRARNGAVRRAAVRPGRDRLIFLDVPRSVLREVLARLY